MAEPTLRTASTPLDRQDRGEWRQRMVNWLGIDAFTSLSSLHQTELDRIIDAAHEYVSQRHGHTPWLRRVTTLSLVADQATYAMPADFRHLREILEGTGNNLTKVTINTETEWLDLFPSTEAGAGAAHPWTDQDRPHWIYRGLDASNPPVVVYQRVPTPSAAGTNNVTVHYRPYQDLMTASNFGELPPSLQEATIEHARGKHALFTKDPVLAQTHFAAREDEIRANAINDNKENEDAIILLPPANVLSEMHLYDHI